MSGRTELPSGLVTFIFTDIEGSTRLARMLGDDYCSVLRAHRTLLRGVLRDFDGVEMFTEGDSFFVAFRDAGAALAACVEAQRRLSAHEWPFPDAMPRVRMGMHTGYAKPIGDEYASIEVHRAARVAAAAHGGQILCSGSTALAVLTAGVVVPFEASIPAAPQLVTAGAAATAAPGSATEVSGSVGPAAAAPDSTGLAAAAMSGSATAVSGSAAAMSGSAAAVSGSAVAMPGSAGAMPGSAGAVPGSAGAGAGPVAECLSGVDLLDLGPHRLRGFDDDERLFQVMAAGLDRDFPRPRTPGAARHNLPAPLTSFVGRRAELSELSELLTRHRIVTITGPGGAGKTRLSLALGEQALPAYPQGIWTVDAVSAATGLAPALAAALGLRAEPGRPVLDTLLEECAGRRMLLLLQTCDAAPTACAGLVQRLLAACPGVDVLVTGRQPLGVYGEVVWRIPPLSPADAFTLLSERSEAARGGRQAPVEESVELAGVAARLEGSPLAIELAAARMRLFSAEQLVARLDDPIAALDPINSDPINSDLITADPGEIEPGERGEIEPGERGEIEPGERHTSLTACLDWSYRTLSVRSAALLRRLSVFAGTVDLPTVEWCGPDAIGSLSELTEKSLIEVVPGPRYRMSEQVRAYASRQLIVAGDERAARDRHLAWSLHTLAAATVDTDGQPRTVSLTERSPYVSEWQAALRWAAADGSVEAGLRLAGVLDPWWREHGGAREGRDLLFRLYRRLDDTPVAPADLASAYLMHARLADDPEERVRFAERAERMARRADDQGLVVRAMAGHRLTLLEEEQYDAAEKFCREMIARAEQYGVPEAGLPAVVTLAELLWRRDAADEAAEVLGGARQLEAGRPEDRGRRTVDWLLGMVALRRRDLVAAHDHLVVALRSRLRHGFRGAAADAVAAIAVRCSLGGDPTSAAVLFGGAEAARGARRTDIFGRFWAEQQLALRTALGDAAFDAAYADGVGLGFDRIVAMALAVEHPDLEDGAVRFAQTLT
ncbi:adenylate/guanylate cyclase domain-containing protein [Actinoplanes sp. KI2]|uniref:adenylate/guanylate cyclase domain-containing protein n=1 Tax=Actinoplanes sp. KI2 TaxID=2983315 RepID=UPI0021D5BDB7|nr:adenylate/guanylate cyclase domain-containing protein [Actinoplanes sp. KI2]MCU7730172.1 adenylate/guanylate cyclase domain-containing protein [Actinoplanes sp. KI2]